MKTPPAALALGLAAALAAAPASAALQTNSWINYIDQNPQSVDFYGRGFRSISVFTYDFDVNGNLGPARPWVDQELAAMRADRQGRLLFVTVTNDIESSPPVNFSGDLVQNVLSDPGKRAALVSQIAAASGQADGVEIDFEALHASTHDLFTQFIQELRAALPAGKKLAVTAQPKTSDAVGERGQAIDWRAIGPYVDQLRVMTYYYSWSTSAPGPSASVADIRSVASFALGEVPADKLSMVLTLYGWDWPSNGPGVLINYQQALARAAQFGATLSRDPSDLDLKFSYVDGAGVSHQVWIDDDTSLRPKISALQSMGITQVDVWSLGAGDPNFWSYVAEQNGAPAPTAGGSPGAAGTGAAPSLTSLSPASVQAGAAAFNLTIDGSGFTPGDVVYVNGLHRPTSYQSATRLVAYIPMSDVAAAGAAVISVAASGGAASNGLPFAILGGASSPGGVPTAPAVASVGVSPGAAGVPAASVVSPSSVPAGSAPFNLTVDGAGFTSASLIRFNGADRPGVVQGTTRLISYIPSSDVAAPGLARVTAYTPGLGESAPLAFSIGPAAPVAASAPPPAGPPSISALSPASAPSGSAPFNLTVDGAGFTSASVIRFNGADRPGVVQGTTRLISYIPTSDVAAAGSARVTAFTPGLGESNPLPFSISAGAAAPAAPASAPAPSAAAPAPSISVLTPSTLPAGGTAFNLTVDGAGFAPGAVVKWNGLTRPGVLQGATRLIVYIGPEDIAAAQNVQVTVANPAPGGASNALPFTVTAKR